MDSYERDIRAKYGQVFREGLGREVFADILRLCNFPGSAGSIYMSLDPDNKEQIGKFNIGLAIAERSGLLEQIGIHFLGLKKKVNDMPE